MKVIYLVSVQSFPICRAGVRLVLNFLSVFFFGSVLEAIKIMDKYITKQMDR